MIEFIAWQQSLDTLLACKYGCTVDTNHKLNIPQEMHYLITVLNQSWGIPLYVAGNIPSL